MSKSADPKAILLRHCLPHILVVEQDPDHGAFLVDALRSLSIRAKHTRAVDEFLDLNCKERIDLVSLEVDARHPETLDNIKLLRTHFGEGPGTMIVALASFTQDVSPVLVEQCGADLCLTNLSDPQAKAVALENALRRRATSTDWGHENGPGPKE